MPAIERRRGASIDRTSRRSTSRPTRAATLRTTLEVDAAAARGRRLHGAAPLGTGPDARAATSRAKRAGTSGPTRGPTAIASRALAAATGGTLPLGERRPATLPLPEADGRERRAPRRPARARRGRGRSSPRSCARRALVHAAAQRAVRSRPPARRFDEASVAPRCAAASTSTTL